MLRSLLPALAAWGLAIPAFAGDPDPKQSVWPAPPEPARIRYVGTLRDESDIKGKASGISRFLKSIVGTKSRPARMFVRPTDVYAEDSTHLYVTDAAAQSLLRIDLEARTVSSIGTSGQGQLAKPAGIIGDGRGRIYVADPGARRIVVFDLEGTYLRHFGGHTTLLNPIDVAVHPATGRVYVADSHTHQIVIFDSTGAVVGKVGKDIGSLAARDSARAVIPVELEDSNLTHARRGASDLTQNRGSKAGEFLYPVAVAVLGDSALCVTDALNGRIQVFDLDGVFLRQFGRLADSPGSFARPKGVTADSDGHLYVVDAAFNNVQIFDTAGRLLLTFGKAGTGDGEFWLPLGLHIDRNNRIYIADRYNGRLQIFQYLNAPEGASLMMESHSQLPQHADPPPPQSTLERSGRVPTQREE